MSRTFIAFGFLVCACITPCLSQLTTMQLEAKLNATLATLNAKEAALSGAMNTFWVMFSAVLVFFMQAGFGMLEAGTVGFKNHYNILVKNVCDASVAGIIYWLFGYGFAFGTDMSGFIGGSMFALPDLYESFLFQWAFAATAATIVSGSVAERTRFSAYLIYTCFITGFIYPVVVHWVWGGGWLSKLGMIDFAGSGVVHMVGGVAGLIGASMVGPRTNRFLDGGFGSVVVDEEKFQVSNILSCALGTFILWFGWYGFNAGSTLAIYGDSAGVATLAAMNTTLAPAFAAVTTLLTGSIVAERARRRGDTAVSVNVCAILNSVLAGLVAVTAPCAVVKPASAALIGVVSSPLYLGSSWLLKQLRVDDPLDAAPIHMFCGLWGVLAVGLFGDAGLGASAGLTVLPNGQQLGVQAIGALAITGWTAVCCGFIFLPLRLLDLLRVDKATEEMGLDRAKHLPVVQQELVSEAKL